MNPKMNAISVIVADMEAAIQFYARLGIDFKSDDGAHASSELPGGLRMMLDTEDMVRSIVPGWSRPTGGYPVAFAFEFSTPAEVDAKFAELASAGSRSVHEPWDAFWGQRYATVLDPDDNAVDLYCTLPRT